MRPQLAATVQASAGVFTRAQARAAGYSPEAIKHRLATGQWLALRRGIYTERAHYERFPPGSPERHALDAAAALLALGRHGGAVVSHQSAARLHGLELLEPPPPLVVITRPRCRTKAPGVRAYRATMPPGHTARVHGVPVTSVARTVVDLARSLPFRDAVVTADAALHARKVTRAELEGMLAACRGWPGSDAAAAVVQFADPSAESVAESLARVMFCAQGLPPPEPQAWIGGFRVDFLWREHDTVVEVDGLQKYTGKEAVRKEKLRQARLEARGYQVVRLLKEQILYEGPASARRIRAAFAAAAARRRP